MLENSLSPPVARPRDLLWLWIGCCLLSLLLHAPAFDRDPQGDELVYLVLAGKMNWDLTDYNTIDTPVAWFPYSIYRQPLFHHGPLYPLVIKAGRLFDQPVNAALSFGILTNWLFLSLILLGRRLAPAGLLELGTSVALATVCPLLMFTSTRLLHDGIAGVLLLAGLVAFAFARERRSRCLAALAGLLSAAALNTRYNSLLGLPMLLAVQLFGTYRAALAELPPQRCVSWPVWRRRLRTWDNWKEFAVVAAIVGTIGMQHFYRVFAEYGTLNPHTFIRPDANLAELLPASQVWESRTRLHSLWQATLLLPVLLLPVLPQSLRRVVAGLRQGDWGAFFVVSCGYFLAVWLAFSHAQLRYLAFSIPHLYFALPWLLGQLRSCAPRTTIALVGLTAVSAVGTSCFMTLIQGGTIDVVPVYLLYLSFYLPLDELGWGG